MSFLLACPNCGPRSVYEFEFGGEYHPRPSVSAGASEWAHYLHFRVNAGGPQTEWWYHRQGCKRWFLSERDTTTNEVRTTFWPEERPGQKPPDTTPPSAPGSER